MYVADVTDIDELAELLAEAWDRVMAEPSNEQAQWDVQDIEDRIVELSR
jgi:hypothetical protein